METFKIAEEAKEYWENVGPPMAFKDKPKSYSEKRSFRYDLHDYLLDEFGFDNFSRKKVLDLGCGAGIDALEFAKRGADVTALDFSESAVEATKQLFVEADLKGQVVHGDALNLPFEDNTFDCVYSFGVLHHIPDVEKALEEIHRILKQEGAVMAMFYNRDSLLIANMLYFKGIKEGLTKNMSIDEIISKYSERIVGNPYTKAYTKEEVKKLFSKTFKDVEVKVKYNVIDTDKQRKIKIGIPDDLELGWHLIIKARK